MVRQVAFVLCVVFVAAAVGVPLHPNHHRHHASRAHSSHIQHELGLTSAPEAHVLTVVKAAHGLLLAFVLVVAGSFAVRGLLEWAEARKTDAGEQGTENDAAAKPGWTAKTATAIHPGLDALVTERAAVQAHATARLIAPAAVVLAFVALRARVHLIVDDQPFGLLVRFGCVPVVLGAWLLAADSLGLRVQSQLFGNVSHVVGDVLAMGGVAVVLWGLIAVHSPKHTQSAEAKTVIALAFAATLPAVLASAFDTSVRVYNQAGLQDFSMDKVVNVVQHVTSVCTTVMLVFVYLTFLPWTTDSTFPYPAHFPTLIVIAVFFKLCGAIMTIAEEVGPFVAVSGRFMRIVASIALHCLVFVLLVTVWSVDPPAPANVLFLGVATALVLGHAVVDGVGEGLNSLIANRPTVLESDDSRIQSTVDKVAKLLPCLLLGQMTALVVIGLHFHSELMNSVPSSELFASRMDLAVACYGAVGAWFLHALLVGLASFVSSLKDSVAVQFTSEVAQAVLFVCLAFVLVFN